MKRKIFISVRNFILKIKYPNRDIIWKSRKWNRKYTDYVDLSG